MSAGAAAAILSSFFTRVRAVAVLSRFIAAATTRRTSTFFAGHERSLLAWRCCIARASRSAAKSALRFPVTIRLPVLPRFVMQHEVDPILGGRMAVQPEFDEARRIRRELRVLR